MCGIAGTLVKAHPASVNRYHVAAMLETQAHRGPDGSGMWSSGNFAIGHRQLRINGDQKQPFETDNLVAVFNGELYGLPGTDGAWLVGDFDRRGVQAFPLWNGMFAAAFFDKQNRTLTLVRDRFGEKPLYYYDGPDVFVFASELKALLGHPKVPVAEDEIGVAQYREWGHTIGGRTMFAGIRRLEPGCWLTVDTRFAVSHGRYWRLPEQDAHSQLAPEELRELLDEAVADRVASDVPTGCYLSGGVDSTAVYALAGGLDTSLPAFTGWFGEPGFSELAYAGAAARDPHHTVRITPQDFLDEFDRIIWHMDEPTAGPGVFPQWVVAKLAAQHVKVCLGGHGGDEIFGGYARHFLVSQRDTPRGYENYRLPDAYPHTLDEAQRWDCAEPLQALLHVEDRVSMAHGLETRMPFLDHRIAGHVFKLTDPHWRIGKRLLKMAVRDVVPGLILDRRDKRGFPVPLVKWANEHRGVREFVRERIGYTPDLAEPWTRSWWGDLCLESWRRQFLTNKPGVRRNDSLVDEGAYAVAV